MQFFVNTTWVNELLYYNKVCSIVTSAFEVFVLEAEQWGK
jgi:hypothetical protein